MRRPLSLILVFAATSLWAGPAHGQNEDGVFVDPDSPAGQEYALPVEQARRDAAGGGSAVTESGGSQALFGDGIRPRGAAAARSDGTGRRASGRRPGTGGHSPTNVRVPNRRQPALPAIAAAVDGPPLFVALGLPLAVVAFGAGLGVGLRMARRRRHEH